jgi:hypothetical protein
MNEDSTASASETSSKRHEKVSSAVAELQEEGAPPVLLVPRTTATTFKSDASMEEEENDDDDMEEHTPSHSNKKYPPLPELDLIPDIFAEPPDMGPAVLAGDARPIYSILSMLPDASTKTPKKNPVARYA